MALKANPAETDVLVAGIVLAPVALAASSQLPSRVLAQEACLAQAAEAAEVLAWATLVVPVDILPVLMEVLK